MFSKFITKRFFLSLGSMVAFTWLCSTGKLTGDTYVLGMLGAIAGNHAQDLIAAWRGNAVPRAS